MPISRLIVLGKVIFMICKFCGKEVADNIITCPNCGNSLVAITSEIHDDNNKTCPNCKTIIPLDMKFCSKCGWNFEENKAAQKICPKCGAELAEGAQFCLKCGKKVDGKKSKRGIAIVCIIICIIAVAVAGGGYYIHQKNVQEQIEQERLAEEARQKLIADFKEKEKELFDKIVDGENTITKISDVIGISCFMDTTGIVTPSAYVSFAESQCPSDFTQEKNRKKEVDKLVKEIKDLNCNEEEIKDLKDAMDDFVDAYDARYDFMFNGNFHVAKYLEEEAANNKDYKAKKEKAEKAFTDLENNSAE